jgi:hypothetical protein
VLAWPPQLEPRSRTAARTVTAIRCFTARETSRGRWWPLGARPLPPTVR